MSLKKICAVRDPFLLIEEGHLTIKTKTGEMLPFIMNKAQRKLHGIVKKLWQENKIIRVFILKARQLGMSTYVEALIYSITSQLDNQNSTIIADDIKGSNYIFEMSKLYQEQCPEYLRPEVKRSNEKKLEFDKTHSQILIDTAENPEAGRKYTFRTVHLSEYAFFKKAKDLMLGLSQSVPAMPRTIIVKETTANGFNFAKDEWDDAVEGKNDYVPIFCPWYWGEEYRMKDTDFDLGDSTLGEISRAEPQLMAQMMQEGITLIEERLIWRRWCVRNNCNGSVEAFKQEYPSTPDEAFIASGECYFDKIELANQLKGADKPLFRANIVKENFKYVLRKCVDGDFSFYCEPSPSDQYVVAGDACSGSGLDNAGLVARCKRTNEIVAVFHAKVDPDELAFRAMMLGSLLNNATVAIENDKFGFAANKKLLTIYGNVYVQRTYNKVENKVIEKIGWETNSVTRPLMLSQMQEEIREGTLPLRFIPLIKECLTFIKNPESKKAEAMEGKHDDLVISCAISGQIRHQDPYKVPKRPMAREFTEAKPSNAGMRFSKRS